MRTTSFLLLLPLSLLFFVSCDRTGQEKGAETPGTDTTGKISSDSDRMEADIHNSQNSLDWAGVYTGTVPCADCEGIETRISLTSNNEYIRTLTYLGKSDGVFEDKGAITWAENGNIITLGEGEGAQSYHVGENMLFHLDREGQRITGDLAEKYQLMKAKTDARIERKTWVLSELMGKKVETSPGNREAHMTLDPELGRVSGNNSCNLFNASYELMEGDRIRFGKGMNTLMACPDMETGQLFMDVLEKADNYSVTGEMLTLNKARMAPLARFIPATE